MPTRLRWIVVLSVVLLGCGTTRWSDTPRTATEQLLLSNAMDRAVSRLDFRALAGRKVFLDTKYLQGITDAAYLTSSLRQQMLANGCIVKDERDQADYIVEARAGAVGTDRNDLLYGIPQTKLPVVAPVPGVPSQIPEIALAKRTNQRGVAKIALFAYNRTTGRPVWQSGTVPAESKAKDLWVFGAGPFQHGSIYDGTMFAGSDFEVPLIQPGAKHGKDALSVTDEAFFVEPAAELAQRPEHPKPDSPAHGKPDAKAPNKPAGPAPDHRPPNPGQPDPKPQDQAPPNPGDGPPPPSPLRPPQGPERLSYPQTRPEALQPPPMPYTEPPNDPVRY
jgi:hypothetical protein